MSNKHKSITQAKLIQTIKDNIDGNSKRFAFLLGAGASVTSGIPAGVDLAKQWFDELEDCNPDAHQIITKDKDFNPDNLASLYSKIYQHRFTHSEDGYNQIEQIMTKESVKPSLGYIMLADFLIKTSNNIVITTNFDRLPETALLTTFSQHAKVIYHENMLPIVTMEHIKPMIVKIHNDAFFQPLNNNSDIADLSEAWKKIIDQILNTYHLIVLGYGGNDREGLKKYLAENKHANHIYWCVRGEREPPADINCYRVQISGFDEFMFALYHELSEDNVSKLKAIQEKIKRNAEESEANLNEQIDKLYKSHKLIKSTSEKTNMQKHLESFAAKTWWDYQSKIFDNKIDDEKDRLYQEGIQNFPNSAELYGNYALFLYETGRDYNKAEKYYQHALKIAPFQANNLGNFALFLHNIRKDYDKAEKYFLKSLEINPLHATNLGNYALFLKNIRKDYDKAEKYFQKALEIDPFHVYHCGNYAIFLEIIRKDYDKAEEFYLRALNIAPGNAINSGNYATFLHVIQKDYNKAEIYYQKSLEINPNHANNNGNYAGILLSQGRKEKAMPYLEKAEILAEKDDLKLELLFYRLAHFPDNHTELRKQINKLLEQNVRSIDWNFDANIERAEKDGCTYVDELRSLAKQITTE